MCWLRVYAWLRVKIKAKGTSVGSVLSWSLDERTRQFLMCWLRVKIKAKGTSVGTKKALGIEIVGIRFLIKEVRNGKF